TGISVSMLPGIVIAAAFALLLLLLLRGSATRLKRILSERSGRRRLRRVLRKRSPDLIENLIIPGAYGGLTKIDCAVLTSGGILCIQVKHCDGIVFGSEKEPQWKNVAGVRQRKFLNPVIQNAGRTKALQNVVPEVPVANLVVFTGPARLTAPKVRNAVRLRDLDGYIAKFVFGPCRIKDWDGVWLTVKSAALTDEDSARDFRAQLSFS
ncbi:MAG TPA: nuclease-related domain-containing protein, partial [Woeseiaceae bacterium]|nr:nuclease-related domain-containing protein [Woeseiaceae bacterium]